MIRAGDSTQNEVYRVQVLDRVFQILDILADSDSGIGLTELAGRLGVHKSTTHRLVMVLEAGRYVERNPSTGRCHLGSRLIELGLSAAAQMDVYEIARPHLRALAEEAGETAHLAVLREGEIVSIVKAESTQNLRTPITVGTRTPAHCTSLGKAILAFGPSDRADSFLKDRKLKAYTSKTITSHLRFKAELRAIRERGYSVDDEEREIGLRCIAAPVWNSVGEVIAAISIAGPAFRITEERVSRLSRMVMGMAGRISSSLGYREPKNGKQFRKL
ncbi:MAG: IclR family transcriptional regulator [Bryobacteraceae bacterium]